MNIKRGWAVVHYPAAEAPETCRSAPTVQPRVFNLGTGSQTKSAAPVGPDLLDWISPSADKPAKIGDPCHPRVFNLGTGSQTKSAAPVGPDLLDWISPSADKPAKIGDPCH